MTHDSELTRLVIGCAIEVHRILGPGLLESVYEDCLCDELTEAGIRHDRQFPMPIVYKGRRLGSELRIDIRIGNDLIVEVKAVQAVLPVHEAQLLSYLRLSGVPLGLLINFNEATLKQGLRRRCL